MLQQPAMSCAHMGLEEHGLLALQVPTAAGRFLVSNPVTIPSKVAHDALAKAFPGYKFPECKDEPPKHVIDNSKVRAPCQHALRLHNRSGPGAI